MHACFPDITPSLFRMHRQSRRQPKWATLKLQDDFSMRYSSQLIVPHILHFELSVPCKSVSPVQPDITCAVA